MRQAAHAGKSFSHDQFKVNLDIFFFDYPARSSRGNWQLAIPRQVKARICQQNVMVC